MKGVNQLDRGAFVERFGPLFEHSPWVAEEAWEDAAVRRRRRAARGARAAIVRRAPRERRLALIRAHPDLAGRAAIAGALTAARAASRPRPGSTGSRPTSTTGFTRATAAYRERFGFPFVVCAREHTRTRSCAPPRERLEHTRDEEGAIALAEIAKIARLRLEDLRRDARISYGKLAVPVHASGRHSAARGPDRRAARRARVRGRASRCSGRTSSPPTPRATTRDVVATDTMKNVILREALGLRRRGARGFPRTPRAALPRAPTRRWRGCGCRARAAVRAALSTGASERPAVRARAGATTGRRARSSAARRRSRWSRRARPRGLLLLKTTGSAFTRFARDEATTLPERADRPLFIHLDVDWRYADPADALAATRRATSRGAGARRRRDGFDEFVSRSRSSTSCTRWARGCSTRYPELAEVSFAAENHTRDPVPASDRPRRGASTPTAFPAYGPDHAGATRA